MIREFNLKWKYRFTTKEGDVMYEDEGFHSRKEAMKMAKWTSRTFGLETCNLFVSQFFEVEKVVEGGNA